MSTVYNWILEKVALSYAFTNAHEMYVRVPQDIKTNYVQFFKDGKKLFTNFQNFIFIKNEVFNYFSLK